MLVKEVPGIEVSQTTLASEIQSLKTIKKKNKQTKTNSELEDRVSDNKGTASHVGQASASGSES